MKKISLFNRLFSTTLLKSSLSILPALSVCTLSSTLIPAYVQAAEVSPIRTIKILYSALNKAENAASPKMREKIIAPAVDQTFDIETITQRTLGTHYNQLTPAERSEILHVFRKYTIASYVSNFTPKQQAAFSISSKTSPNPTGGEIVNTSLRGKGDPAGSGTPVNYVIKNTQKGWRITDVLLNGQISQTSTQRSDYRTIINQSGIKGLIDMLNKKADGFLNE